MDHGVSTSKDGGGGVNGSDSPSKDKLFDPSIDMLVNDFDDERTLEEEEALAAGEADDPSAELSNLEKEGNMPLEELLTLYGYNNADIQDISSESEEEEEMQEEMHRQEEEQICEPIVEKERSPTPPRHSKLSILYEPIIDDIDDSRNLHTVSRISDDEDEYGSGVEDDDYRKVRKTIMVGGDYQAQIPEGLIHYDNVPPYANDDELLWTPQETYSQKVEDYLKKAHEICKPPVPNGNVLRDDEDALYVLQQCGYNTEEALKKLESRPPLPPCPAANNINDIIWSEEECRSFEAGVRTYGKDFHLIQQNKVKTRSVGDLVQFYYLWKKTERHDVFANKIRLEKKKYAVHPGLTDFMDRFLEDHERDHNASPGSTSVHGKGKFLKSPNKSPI